VRGKVIIVLGLIGSGKTTLSEELAKALGPDTLWLPEPDEKEGRNPYLSDYYHSPERWALTMQVHLLSRRFRQHLQAQWYTMNTGLPAVMDSSYWQDTAFARLQLRLGLMSQAEFDTYALLYQAMTASVLFPSAVVRILTTAETCQARISSRLVEQTGRKCENAINPEYLRNLDEEIDLVCRELRRAGITVFDVPYDADRGTEEAREQTVSSLAARIKALALPDPFLRLHGRRPDTGDA